MTRALMSTLGKTMPDRTLDALTLAIVRQAMEDWAESASSLRRGRFQARNRERFEEVSAFFESDWFTVLTGMKGEDFLQQVFPTRKERINDGEISGRYAAGIPFHEPEKGDRGADRPDRGADPDAA